MVFVRPQQFAVTLRAVEALVTVAPHDGVQFGRLLPGGAVEKTIELLPNEAASRLAAGKPVQVVLPKDLPQGVKLVAEPAAPQLGTPITVRLRITAAADAALPAQGYKGKIEFSGLAGLAFRPPGLPMSFEASRPEIDVTPETIDFGTVGPGGEAVREIYFSPNEAASAATTTVSLANETRAAKGVGVEIDPAQVAIKGKTTIHVKLRLAANAAATGELKGAILVKAADRAVGLARNRLIWRARTAKAVVDVIPGDQLDFGALEPGQRQTRSLWLAPNEAAAAKKPTVRLDADGLPAGASLSFEPKMVAVGRKQEVKVTLVAGPELGPQKVKLKLTSDSPDVELAVSRLAAIYAAETGWIKFDVDQLDYGDLLPGNSVAERRVRVAASQGAIGDTVRLDWDFGKLPQGMSVTPLLKQVTISQAGQEATLGLSLLVAVPGSYEGKVVFHAKSAVRPTELPVRIRVPQRLVEIVGAPEEWSIKVWPFFPRGAGELPLVARANPAAAGTTISLRSRGELPNGITLDMNPSSLKVAMGENSMHLVASVESGWHLFTREFAGQMDVVADSPQTVVRPAVLRWRVVVPGLWPYLAGAILLALLVWWPHRPVKVLKGNEAVGGLKLEEKPATVKVLLQGAEKRNGEMLLIGMLKKYSVYVGAPKQAKDAIRGVAIQGDSAVHARHVRIYRRGSRHWIHALHPITVIAANARRSIGRGGKERLYHDDKLQIGQVVLTFRNPGDVRPRQPAVRRR